MSDWEWSKSDEKGISRFVLDNATDWVTNPRPPVNWNDMHGSVGDREALVRSLYDTLRRYPVRYTPEKFQPDQALQIVRRPDEILDRPGEGTCLDLALLFCGICLGCDLIPLLIRVTGHAFVMVSLTHRFRDGCKLPRQGEWQTLAAFPMKDAGLLKGWIDGGRYLAVECTGFARGKVLGTGPEAGHRDAEGLLSFEDACRAGRAQFDVPTRPLEYTIDLAVARHKWNFEPYQLRSSRRASARPTTPAPLPARPASPSPEMDELPNLIDRVAQKDALFDSLDQALNARSGRPTICFMEGDGNQGHHWLVRRLVRFDLPDWLRLRMSEQGLQDVQVDLPSRASADFDTALRRELGQKLNLRSAEVPSWDEVSAWLADQPGRVFFQLTFNTSSWLEDGPARLERLLKSWRLCGELDPIRTPIVCVQVVYEPQAPASRWGRWLGLAKDPNEPLRQHFRRLEAECKAETNATGVRVVRLEPLANVFSGDLIAWQGLAPIQAFRPGIDFTAEIAGLFDGKGAGLPMVQVVPHLRDWLRPYAKGV